MSITLEICADSIASALAAAEGGADRIELCANLSEGGVTPSFACIEVACQTVDLPIYVLIRPRAGDFLYSEAEYEVMKRDIGWAKQAGAQGIVSGLLLANGQVNIPRTAQLIDLAYPLPFTFHRAFDVASDPFEALQALIHLGVNRLLTSGQAASAAEGALLITQLVVQAAGKLIIMPGSGVQEQTIQQIRQQTGATEFHSSARASRQSCMTHRPAGVTMGNQAQEYMWSEVDPARVRAIRHAAEMMGID